MTDLETLFREYGKPWESPEDALAELRSFGIIPPDKWPPEAPSGRGVTSAVTVWVGQERWPVWRSVAQALCRAGLASWSRPAPVAKKPKPGPAAKAADKPPKAQKPHEDPVE